MSIKGEIDHTPIYYPPGAELDRMVGEHFLGVVDRGLGHPAYSVLPQYAIRVIEQFNYLGIVVRVRFDPKGPSVAIWLRDGREMEREESTWAHATCLIALDYVDLMSRS